MSFEARYEALHTWIEDAVRSGWLPHSDLDTLVQIERQQSAQLFSQQRHRPLIVGLFGGTGVGKSSLLNRLAGAPVARVGVERPTSHEVTLYLHRDFAIHQLPPELPLQDTRLAYHADADRRLLAWLDMPDIDSTATANRALVEAWLPYVDWLIYVVSPERYHDDLGWRFLQQRAQRHAWLFVMNHWDQGRPEQIEDLRQRLQDEAFSQPTILRTSCATEGGGADDFAQLEGTIRGAVDRYGLEVLQQLGVQARIADLRRSVARCRTHIGDDTAWLSAHTQWSTTVDVHLHRLGEQLQRRIAALGTEYLARHAERQGWWHRLRGQPRARQDLELVGRELVARICDGSSEARLVALDEQLIAGLQGSGLAHRPLVAALADAPEPARTVLGDVLAADMLNALAYPGTRLQRGLFRLCGWLGTLLPLAAGAWIAYHVTRGFYLGTQGQGEFLGPQFVVHGALLMVLAWLLPWLAAQRLRPSPIKAMLAAVRTGVGEGLERLQAGYAERWGTTNDERRRRLVELDALDDAIAALQLAPLAQIDGILSRR